MSRSETVFGQNLISLSELAPADLRALIHRAAQLGGPTPPDPILSGCSVGILFTKTSTRTRTAFWAGATRLGADVITYGPDDLQLNTGESYEDTARVLAQYLDALVVRTNGDIRELRQLGIRADLAVINALTLDEHPTQAIADLATLVKEFGDLSGRHLLYVGEGNSTAAALALATALTPGFRLTLLCPPGYGLGKEMLDRAAELSDGTARISQYEHLKEVKVPVDAVYTSRWQTMGVTKADPDWLSAFRGYRVDADLFGRVGTSHTVFLHDLPAIRGQEVSDEILDGERSRAWQQARHKMTAAMAVLEWCLAGGTRA